MNITDVPNEIISRIEEHNSVSTTYSSGGFRFTDIVPNNPVPPSRFTLFRYKYTFIEQGKKTYHHGFLSEADYRRFLPDFMDESFERVSVWYAEFGGFHRNTKENTGFRVTLSQEDRYFVYFQTEEEAKDFMVFLDDGTFDRNELSDILLGMNITDCQWNDYSNYKKDRTWIL